MKTPEFEPMKKACIKFGNADTEALIKQALNNSYVVAFHESEKELAILYLTSDHLVMMVKDLIMAMPPVASIKLLALLELENKKFRDKAFDQPHHGHDNNEG